MADDEHNSQRKGDFRRELQGKKKKGRFKSTAIIVKP